jgi:hypothetical protein
MDTNIGLLIALPFVAVLVVAIAAWFLSGASL